MGCATETLDHQNHPHNDLIPYSLPIVGIHRPKVRFVVGSVWEKPEDGTKMYGEDFSPMGGSLNYLRRSLLQKMHFIRVDHSERAEGRGTSKPCTVYCYVVTSTLQVILYTISF